MTVYNVKNRNSKFDTQMSASQANIKTFMDDTKEKTEITVEKFTGS